MKPHASRHTRHLKELAYLTWARNSRAGARAAPPVAMDVPSRPVLESSSASSTYRCSGSARNTATARPACFGGARKLWAAYISGGEGGRVDPCIHGAALSTAAARGNRQTGLREEAPSFKGEESSKRAYAAYRQKQRLAATCCAQAGIISEPVKIGIQGASPSVAAVVVQVPYSKHTNEGACTPKSTRLGRKKQVCC